MKKAVRAWVFTLNNYGEIDEFELSECKKFDYIVYGKEVGEGGTPHLQGYIYSTKKLSLRQLKKISPKAHWEQRKGTHQQAREYCIKDGDFFEQGTPPQKNGGDKLADRAAMNKKLIEKPLTELVAEGEISILTIPTLKKARNILKQELESFETKDCRGIWIYGPPGTGKSHSARTEYGESLFIKAQNKWFDGYEGQKVIVLDDLDTPVLGHYLKIWADKWSCTGEVKGGTVPLVHETFIITSNYLPQELWAEDQNMQNAILRRFKIIKKLIKFI